MLGKTREELYKKEFSKNSKGASKFYNLWAETFAIVNMVQFILAQSFTYSILAASSCILILCLQKLISKKPEYINYVITFYQFYVLFIIEINNILASGDRANLTFAWSYGYQTGFMHFCLYLQGTTMIGSTIVLLIVTTIHVAFFPYNHIYTLPHIFSFIFMFACQIAIKYNHEKRKKEEFFYSYQQEQWELIIRKSISNSMILIRYDQKQDQLRLVKQSIQSQNLHEIQDCHDLRQFLRNLVETQPVQKIKEFENGSQNLEEFVRQQLIFRSEKYIHKPSEKKHYIDQTSRIVYNVKLNRFILNNELQCLLILDKIQISNNQFQVMQMLMFSELSISIAKQLRIQLEFQMCLKMLKWKNNLNNNIKENYFIQTTLFYIQLLINNQNNIPQEEINELKLQQLLKQIFEQKCQFNCPFIFIHQQQYILSIILTCSNLIQHCHGGVMPEFSIQFRKVNRSEVEMILCFFFSDQNHYNKAFQILQANWFGSNKRQFNKKQLYQNCIERLCLLQSQYQLPTLLLFNICAMQIVMSQICEYNHFKVQRNLLSLELQCTFYDLQ